MYFLNIFLKDEPPLIVLAYLKFMQHNTIMSSGSVLITTADAFCMLCTVQIQKKKRSKESSTFIKMFQ